MNPQHEAHERLCKAIGDMVKENEALKQRIKLLEEVLDEVYHAGRVGASLRAEKAWHKAKKAKP